MAAERLKGPALLAMVLWVLGGCGRSTPGTEPNRPTIRVEPIAVQQYRAYPEAVTGRFVCLADFEDAPGRDPGHKQLRHFSIAPPGQEGLRQFVVNVTRTGAGAMRVVLAPKAELVFHCPYVHDFSRYALISVALHSASFRDDLRMSLTTDVESWSSPRKLLEPGWNTILVDLRRLQAVGGLDVTSARTIRIGFADASGPIEFHLDDIMLIDNRRPVEPMPAGIRLDKAGLDYTLHLPGWSEPVAFGQGQDGLWRPSRYGAILQLSGPGQPLAGGGEDLSVLGDRRLGQIEVLEHNAVCLRLTWTWYFPTRGGEWLSLAVRKVLWEGTWYADGRWVTHVELDNSGGGKLGSLRLSVDRPVAWAGGGTRKTLTVKQFTGPVGMWNYLLVPPRPAERILLDNYLRPGRVRLALGVEGAFSPGDGDRDGFDESRGCYFLRAKRGNCRFTIVPPTGGLLNPVFRVAGPWDGPVHVSSEGLAIRQVARSPQGAALFVLPGLIDRPMAVEVTGKDRPEAAK